MVCGCRDTDRSHPTHDTASACGAKSLETMWKERRDSYASVRRRWAQLRWGGDLRRKQVPRLASLLVPMVPSNTVSQKGGQASTPDEKFTRTPQITSAVSGIHVVDRHGEGADGSDWGAEPGGTGYWLCAWTRERFKAPYPITQQVVASVGERGDRKNVGVLGSDVGSRSSWRRVLRFGAVRLNTRSRQIHPC